MDDHALLREYVQNRSDEAFTELVARHVNLVYATALRLMREPHAAQDVVQTVFIQLARKGWMVRGGQGLSGWLHRATMHAGFDALRKERRRRARETEAMKLAESDAQPPAWERLAPLLDEALQQLPHADHDAVMLRYFEGCTARETGAALAMSEGAAQKRLSRALEKLRAYFAREGVVVSAAALATMLTTRGSEAAPAGFAAKVASASLAQGGGMGLAATIGNIILMSTKTVLTMVALFGAVVLIVVGAKWIAYERNRQDDGGPSPSASAPGAPVPAPKPAPPAPVVPVAAAAALPVAQPPSKTAAVTSEATGTVEVSSARSPATAEAQKDLKTAIPEAIRLLEADEFVAFAKAFMPLDAMQENLPPGTTIEQFIQGLRNQPDFAEKRNQLIESLHQMQNGTPTMSNGDTAASFLYELKNGQKKTLAFKEIDGLWYIDRMD